LDAVERMVAVRALLSLRAAGRARRRAPTTAVKDPSHKSLRQSMKISPRCGINV